MTYQFFVRVERFRHFQVRVYFFQLTFQWTIYFFHRIFKSKKYKIPSKKVKEIFYDNLSRE